MNARSLLGASRWRTVARATYGATEGQGCEFCGGIGRRHPLEAHEAWAYEIVGDRGVQRLVGLLALCPACHEAKHYGRAANIGRGEAALARIASLNGWTRERALNAVERCFTEWRARDSVPNWITDVTLAEHLLSDIALAARRRE